MRAPSAPWSGELDGPYPGDGGNERVGPPGRGSTAVRMWLIHGTRAIDPRRSRGAHGPARQMLAEDSRPAASPHDRWSGFVSALRRHTVHTALAQLSDAERQVLTLAFVHGHSNREIAAMLSISVSSVGRRLSAGLAKLENQMWRAGAWVSALVLLLLGYLSRRSPAAQRLVESARATGWSEVLAVSAAATVSVVALGAVVTTHSPAPITHQSVRVAGAPHTIASVEPPTATTDSPATTPAIKIREAAIVPAVTSAGASTRHTDSSSGGVTTTDPGCDGNPTNAAPPVPVESRDGEPRGAPVTHPDAGGCGPHGVKRP